MTVIDVNTGSVLKKKKQEDTLFYQINREAAKEIARQLRLRNISGIIMIDFINMKDTASRLPFNFLHAVVLLRDYKLELNAKRFMLEKRKIKNI